MALILVYWRTGKVETIDREQVTISIREPGYESEKDITINRFWGTFDAPYLAANKDKIAKIEVIP